MSAAEPSLAVLIERLDALDRRNVENFASLRTSTEVALVVANRQLADLGKKIDTVREPKWPLILGAAALFGTMISAFWVVTALKIDASTTPALLGLRAVESSHSLQDHRLDTLDAEQRRQDATLTSLALQTAKLSVSIENLTKTK